MNTILKLIQIYSKDLEYIDIVHGQVIYVKDTLETYYDNEDLYRTNITVNSLFLETENDLNSVYSPLFDRIYIVGENNKMYYNLDETWYPMETEEDLYNTIIDLDDLTPTILEDKGNLVAPKTLDSAVYMNDGSRLSTVLKDPNILTITKTKAIYVEVIKDNQRIFNIPYPISDYDLARNHISLIIRGNLYEPNRYVINNDRLILNTRNSTLVKGETVLFIFYYTIELDLNENVVLSTKNYGDKTITSEKLHDSLKLEASRIIETVERIFMTPEERDKLRGVAYNATCYHHPPTHPADMIVEDEKHRFITDVERYNWNHKANADEVYTKEESEQRLNDLIGSAPECLDTLKEIADSLNNDPNFIETMLKKLALKADKTQIEDVNKILETKIDMDDYIRGGIYDSTGLLRNIEGDFYSIVVNDPKLQEYIDGMQLIVKITETNQMNSYIQVNRLGFRKILTQDQDELIPGELRADSIYTLRYNGSTGNFILQGKGGVKINHSTFENYVVAPNENIYRGNIVDVVENNKIVNSLPRINLKATSYNNSTKYYCNEKIKVKYLNKETIIVAWIDNKHLKLELFKINPSTNEIIFNEIKEPMLLDSECIDFNLEIINSNKLIIAYSNKIKKFNILSIIVKNDELIPDIPLAYEDIEYYTNIKIIILPEKAIVTWINGEITKCMYLRTSGNGLEIISERNNIDYPIDYCITVNEKQLLFIGTTNNDIMGWVMNIDYMDFYNNTILKLKSSVEETYSNFTLVSIGNNKVILYYTDFNKTKQYSQLLEIKENGGILINEPKIISSTDISKNLVTKYIQYEKDIYVSVNNNNNIFIELKNINEKENILLRKNIALFNLKSNIIDFDIYDNHLIIVYSTKIEGENNHLFFSEYMIQRYPDGVSMQNGKSDDILKISEWK